MKLIPVGVTRAVSRGILQTQKHSPTILFATGVAGVVTTAVLAAKATLKLDPLLYDIEQDKAALNSLTHSEYTEDDGVKDKVYFYGKSAYQVGKLYVPTVVAGVATIACFTASNRILVKRNIAITAVAVALEKGFNEYRARVIEDQGEEKDKEYRYGVVETLETVIDDKGKKKVVVHKSVPETAGRSIYARFFDEHSPRWQPGPGYNQTFLAIQQQFATDLLRARGHLFLNEVYDCLGIERSPEGQAVGWVWEKNGTGDGFVDFGIFSGDIYKGQEFIRGDERSILLDFNVDGPIWDRI